MHFLVHLNIEFRDTLTINADIITLVNLSVSDADWLLIDAVK